MSRRPPARPNPRKTPTDRNRYRRVWSVAQAVVETEHGRGEVIFIVDEAGAIRASSVGGFPASDKDLADAFREACEDPRAGTRAKPVRLVTSVESLVVRLRAAIEGVEVERAVSTLADEAVATFERDRDRADRASHVFSYFEHPEVDEALVRRFFEAAKGLYELQPWADESIEGIAQMLVPVLSTTAIGLVLDEEGETHGQALFVLEDLERFDDFLDAMEDEDSFFHVLPAGTRIAFEKLADLPEPCQAAIEHRRFPVAGPSAYPWLHRVTVEGDSVPLGPLDIVRATLACDSLARLITERRADGTDPDTSSAVGFRAVVEPSPMGFFDVLVEGFFGPEEISDEADALPLNH